MLSGDSHNAWAYSLAEEGRPAGIEFAGQSVTSPGIEGQLGVDPNDVARAFVATNPELVWADTSQRGYMMIDITPQRDHRRVVVHANDRVAQHGPRRHSPDVG